MKRKIAIIGSGFGGLSAGIRLQAQGYQVTLFEKNAHPGGHAYPLHIDGYQFDMGPSLITAPDIIQDIFQSAGKDMNDYLDLIKLDPFYRIYYHDKTYLDYTDDTDAMIAQMKKFNPRDANNYNKFIRASKGIHDVVIGQGLGATPFMDWGSMLRFMPKAVGLNALLPTYNFAKRFFKDFRHRFAFSFHPLFIGGNPFRAPSVYQMIPYLEKEGGVWFTQGGMTTLVKAFVQVFKEQGGDLRLQTPVKEIIVENGRATGVVTASGPFHADAVVSNADFIHTHKDLIASSHRKKWSDNKLLSMDYSMSAFLLYLGVRKQYPELKHHTLILSHRYKELIKDIFDNKILPDDFSMYLHVPTKTDPGMAPEGCESMYVLVPVTNLQGNVDWTKQAEPFKNKVLEFLQNDFGLHDLQNNLDVCSVYTPQDFAEQRNNQWGSAWGVEPKLTQTAIFRPHNKSEDIQNLYLVGASTHPGAGLPGVMLTAKTTVSVMAKDLQSVKHKVAV